MLAPEPAGNRLDLFMLSVVRSGVTFTYFGPAASQAEAWKVAENRMNYKKRKIDSLLTKKVSKSALKAV